ncbi:hypothetical protein [Jiulongibacter sp. NS-SX5]|uniref:hypothetical protein n=1 Tax=Jiulongibacter sp. NS-SX5 TaxID=3463854 RepID=UPI0040597295
MTKVTLMPQDVKNIKCCYVNTLLNNWLEIDHKNVTTAIGKMEIAVLVCNDKQFDVSISKEEASALTAIISSGNEHVADTDMAIGHMLGNIFVDEYKENVAVQKKLQSIYQS